MQKFADYLIVWSVSVSFLAEEVASQPECWAKAIEMAALAGPALPAPGERVAVIGCGSSLNVARCYASLREAAGHGETDAFPASQVRCRRYDRLVFVSRTAPAPRSSPRPPTRSPG